jgi:hypothetical protein
MSHRDELRAKIRELEKRITQDESEKLLLQVELNRLKLAEFEEDIRESQDKKLLQG